MILGAEKTLILQVQQLRKTLEKPQKISATSIDYKVPFGIFHCKSTTK